MQHIVQRYLLIRRHSRISLQNTLSGYSSAPCIYIICLSWRPWLVVPYRLRPMCLISRETRALARRRLLLFCKCCVGFHSPIPSSKLTTWRGGGVAGIMAAVSCLHHFYCAFLASYLTGRSKLFLMPRFMTLPSWSTETQSEAELGTNHLARIRRPENRIQLRWAQIG